MSDDSNLGIRADESGYPEGAIAMSERGFPVFADFKDLYNSRWEIQYSSRAFHPAVWVWIQGSPANEGGVGKDGSGHLTLPQAKLVRDALSAWISLAEKQIENGSYWPEPEGNDHE
jgi:hypothetical protein